MTLSRENRPTNCRPTRCLARGSCCGDQEELASAAGITFGTVNRLESAKSAPAWATVRALLDALGYSLADLATAIDAAERRR
jgi:transcriptional regulator with XRE-family HTH domain